MSHFKRRIQNEQEIYEIVMYLNQKVKKSKIVYAPNKELTLFANLDKSFIKFWKEKLQPMWKKYSKGLPFHI